MRPEVGKRYRVTADDCCTHIEFIARLTRGPLDDEGSEADARTYTVVTDWDNGVHLESAFQFTEVP